MRLEGKVAIVTGGAGGLGSGISSAFASEGAHVAIVDNNNMQNGLALVEEIKTSYGTEAVAVKADVSNSIEVKAMVEAVYNRWHKIDILVNNAGISSVSKVEDISEKEWDHVIKVNLTSQFFCAQSIIPYMKRQGYGKIINMGSLNAKNGGVITGGVYATSKGGVHSFTFALAKELAPYCINVNAVAPGPIDTDMIKAYDAERVKNMVDHIPLKRLGLISEVAKTVVFLASSDADYITGEIIDINGGAFTD